MSWKEKIESFGIDHRVIQANTFVVGEEYEKELSYIEDGERKYVTKTLNHIGFLTADGDYIQLKPSREGFPSLCWLFNNRRHFDKDVVDMYSWGKFSAIVGNMFDPFDHKTGLERAKELVTLAKGATSAGKVHEIWLHEYNGMVAGFSKKYNDKIREETILKMLVDEGYEGKISSIYPRFQTNDKSVFFHIALEGITSVYFTLIQGYGGDRAQSYRITVMNDSKELLFVSKPISKNKHMGNLEDTFNSFYKQLQSVKVQELLKRHELFKGIDIISLIHSKIVDAENVKGLKVTKKGIKRLEEAYRDVWNDVSIESQTGIQVLSNFKDACKRKNAETNGNCIVDAIFIEEFISDELLDELRES